MSKNKKLKKIFNELDKSAINLSKDLDKKLSIAYETAAEEILDKLRKIYDKYGDKLTITELRKFNRLSNIENEILKRISSLNNYATKEIQKNIKTQILHAYDNTISGLQSVGINFTEVLIDEDALKLFLSDTLWYDAMKNNSAKLMSDIKREFETVLRANTREEIVSGLISGKSFNELSKTLIERFNVSKNRAKVISLTETHKAQMFGRNEGLKRGISAAQEMGIRAGKVWRHNHIGVPRPDHLAADGMLANKDGLFNVGGEFLEAPGLGFDPSNNINCHCSAEFIFLDEL